MKHYFARQLWQSAFYPLAFLLISWAIFLAGQHSRLQQYRFGVLPRKTEGLKGIVTSIFIHGDVGHIASNTIPVLVLGMMIFYFYKKISKQVVVWIWLISGLWLWIGGRNNETHPSWHIGASTLIYGFASFLFFSGVFRRNRQLMIVSALVVFLYGSIAWGVLPLQPGMSWEGHLFGALAGLLTAFNYRREGPQRKKYDWEDEPDDEEPPAGDVQADPQKDQDPDPVTFTVRYIYRPGQGQDGDQRAS